MQSAKSIKEIGILIFFSFAALTIRTSEAQGFPSCAGIHTLPRATIDIFDRFSSSKMPPHLIRRFSDQFETHLNRMLTQLPESQREQAIEAINTFQFRENMAQMGKFDIQENQLLLQGALRGRILSLVILLHETRHYLDINFRPQSKAISVMELEARAFAAEYDYTRDVLKMFQASEILAIAIANEAVLTYEERFFVEYLFRNPRRHYDPGTKTFLLKDLNEQERRIATGAFNKFDKWTRQQMRTLFQVATMDKDSYINANLQNPRYWHRLNQVHQAQQLSNFSTTR